jgi:hypothetical protein
MFRLRSNEAETSLAGNPSAEDESQQERRGRRVTVIGKQKPNQHLCTSNRFFLPRFSSDALGFLTPKVLKVTADRCGCYMSSIDPFKSLQADPYMI